MKVFNRSGHHFEDVNVFNHSFCIGFGHPNAQKTLSMNERNSRYCQNCNKSVPNMCVIETSFKLCEQSILGWYLSSRLKYKMVRNWFDRHSVTKWFCWRMLFLEILTKWLNQLLNHVTLIAVHRKFSTCYSLTGNKRIILTLPS